MKTWLGVVVVSLLLAACGNAPDEAAPQPGGAGVTGDARGDEPVSITPEPGGRVHDVKGGRAQRVQPRGGMRGLRTVAWKSFVPRGRSAIDVRFWSGVEPCNVLDHVDVEENGDRVVVTLFEGSDPAAEDVACIELALLKVVRVELDQPLGSRKVVDGTRS